MQKEEAQFCIPAYIIVKFRSIANSDFRNDYVSVPVTRTEDEWDKSWIATKLP